MAVTDKTAKDAATAAANAATAASTAQSRADAAYQLAESKTSTAQVETMVTSSANGKNTITLSTAAPSGSGKRPGDTWWRRSGTVIIGQWQWDGTGWLATTINRQVISSVDVNTLLVTGTARMSQAVVDKIVGDAAYFRLLTADKLLVGSASNLIPNGDLAYGQTPWSETLTRHTDSPPPGYSAYLTTSKGAGNIANPGGGVLMPVTPGATYAFEVWVKAGLPDSAFYLELRNQSGGHAGQAGQVVNNGDTFTGGGAYLVQARIAPTVWTRFSCQYTMSESTTQVRLGTFYFNHTASTERNAQVSLGGFRLRPMTGAVLIENGAITASKIATGAITATHIKAGSITSDKLTIANGFITNAMIANAAITDAKISSLSAAKITTGYLAAARIQAGSITSDKLTIANGSITNAMIKDAAVTSAKIASLDAGKITTGYLSANRIAAKSITADKLAANAIQVGLAGWTSSIRISPTQIAWYNGSTLEGTITSWGMRFWYGTRFLGSMGHSHKEGNTAVRGIANQLEYTGDYISWSYKQTSTADTFTTMLTLDPKGKFYGKAGIHLGDDLRTNGYKFYTTGSRYVTLQDATLTGKGTFVSWASSNGLAKVVFHTYDLMVVTNGSYYNMTRLFDRVGDLMSRMNSLIGLFNRGWIVSISGSGSNITWQYYSNTGLSTMSTTLS
ncbi:phage head spike fiber domain-containing protein [Cutibacterium avidum]|uniref:phage head spike fiber domain-containing protein n=1 Tax=Cutibacterium avidum TaxID=33010 RepID=UPI002FEEFD90